MSSLGHPRVSNSQCLSCGIIDKKISTCKVCQWASYCSRECQKKHWSIHKLECCPPIENFKKLQTKYPQKYMFDSRLKVDKSPGKGQGLFACDDIEADQLLIIDSPISIKFFNSKRLVRYISQDEYDSLHLYDKYGTHDSNSFNFDNEGTCCFSLISKVNHSITPNAYYSPLRQEKKYILITKSKIKKGDEITINYVDIKDENYYEIQDRTQKIKNDVELTTAIQELYTTHDLGMVEPEITTIYRQKISDLQNFCHFLYDHVSRIINVSSLKFEDSNYNLFFVIPKAIESFGLYRVLELIILSCDDKRLISIIFEHINPELFKRLENGLKIKLRVEEFLGK